MVSTRASNVKGQNEEEKTCPDNSEDRTPITSSDTSANAGGTITENISNTITVSPCVPIVTTTSVVNASDITNAENPITTSSGSSVTMNTIDTSSTITSATNSSTLGTIGAIIGAMRISMADNDGSEITNMTTRISPLATTADDSISSRIVTNIAPMIDSGVSTTASRNSSGTTNMTTTISSVATSMAASVGSDVTANIPGTCSGARTTTAFIGSCATTMTTKIISVATTASIAPCIPTAGTITLAEVNPNCIQAATSTSPSPNTPTIDASRILPTPIATSSNGFNSTTASHDHPTNSNNSVANEMEHIDSNEFTSATKAVEPTTNSSASKTAVSTTLKCSPSTTTFSETSNTVSISSSSKTDTLIPSGKVSTYGDGNNKETATTLKDAATTNKSLEIQSIHDSTTSKETTFNNSVNVDKRSTQNGNSQHSNGSPQLSPTHSKSVKSPSNKNNGQDSVNDSFSTDATPITNDDVQNSPSLNAKTLQSKSNLKCHEQVFVSLLKYFCPRGEANDPSIFTDVTFFTNDGHSISANKIILFLVCPYFNDMFHKLIETQKDFGSIVVCTGINFCHLKNIFKLIYTGTINPPDDSDELRKIVKEYGMDYCGLSARQSSTSENETSINAISEAGTSTSNSNLSNDESPTSIGELTKSVQTLKWTGRTKCVPQETYTLYRNQNDKRNGEPFLFTDVLLASRTGQHVAANSFVLVLSCPYFRKLFTKLGESKPDRKFTIVFDDIDFCQLNNLVRLIYVGECSVTSKAELEQLKDIISSRFGMEDVCTKDDCTGSQTTEIVDPSQNVENGNGKFTDRTNNNPSETNLNGSDNVPVGNVNQTDRSHVDDSNNDIRLNDEASLNDDDIDLNDEDGQNCINIDKDVNNSGTDGESNDAWSESNQSGNDWIISNRTERVKSLDQSGIPAAAKTRVRYEWEKIETPSNCVLERDWRICRREQQARIERVEYYCAHSPKHKCPAKIISHTFPNKKMAYYANNKEHANHRARPLLTAEQNKFAEKCVDEGTYEPRFVYALMQLEGLGEPDKNKLISKLKRYKREIRAMAGKTKTRNSLCRPNIQKPRQKPVGNSTRRRQTLHRLAKSRNSSKGRQETHKNRTENSTGKTNEKNSQTTEKSLQKNPAQIENGQSSQLVKRKVSKTVISRGNTGRPKRPRVETNTRKR